MSDTYTYYMHINVKKSNYTAMWITHNDCLIIVLLSINICIFLVEWVVAYTKVSTTCAEDGAWQLSTHASTVSSSACLVYSESQPQ